MLHLYLQSLKLSGAYPRCSKYYRACCALILVIKGLVENLIDSIFICFIENNDS